MQLVVGLYALFCIPIRSPPRACDGLNGVGAAPAIQFVALMCLSSFVPPVPINAERIVRLSSNNEGDSLPKHPLAVLSFESTDHTATARATIRHQPAHL